MPHIRDKVLKGHVIRTVQVPNEDVCEITCYQEPNCMSYNYGLAGNESHTCELNARSHQQVSSDDLAVKFNYVYRHILVRNMGKSILKKKAAT